jgi:addiction module HigA family antidote
MTSGACAFVSIKAMPGTLRSLTITDWSFTMDAPSNGMRPIHPGEVLYEEFLLPMGMSAHALAMALHVPAPRINDIVRQRRSITADTAMRLGRFFGMSAEFWMGLQADFDMARVRDALAEDLAAIRPWQARQAA